MRSLLFALAVGAIAPALATKLSSSPDGNCGSDAGFTCLGSFYGGCCSRAGKCGATAAECGTGCQSEFGWCTGKSHLKRDTKKSCPARKPSFTCPDSDGIIFTDGNGYSYQIQCDSDYPGSVVGIGSPCADLNTCIALCSSTDGCAYASFTNGVCTLKSAATGASSSSSGTACAHLIGKPGSSSGVPSKPSGTAGTLPNGGGSWSSSPTGSNSGGGSSGSGSHGSGSHGSGSLSNSPPSATSSAGSSAIGGHGAGGYGSGSTVSASGHGAGGHGSATGSFSQSSAFSTVIKAHNATSTASATKTSSAVPSSSTCNTNPKATYTAGTIPGCKRCDGQPGTDQFCGFDINTNYYENTPITCNVVTYEFDITEATASPDGYERFVMLVNGEFPGPTIKASWGDTVVVKINNKMNTNGTAIHFHGVRQLNNNGNDGVPSVSQCPIAPGDSMTYTWTAENYGTSWYHSHYGIQAWEGVHGPMIIDGPKSAAYDYDLGTFIVADWSHFTVDERYGLSENATQVPGQASGVTYGGPVTMDSGLINGLNVWNGANGNSTPTGSRYEVPTKLQPGKKYLLRFINGAIQSTYKIYLDQHEFTVIANDFVPIKPYTTNILNMSGGQRYEVIVEATSQSGGNFWLRADNQNACASTVQALDIKAIVRYEDAEDQLPTSTAYTYTGECVDEPAASLIPILPLNAGAADITTNDGAYDLLVQGNSAQLYKWYLSGTAFQSQPSDPILVDILNNNTIPDYSGNLLINTPNKGEWVYVIIESVVPLPHPIHLHGHDFFVLGQGTGSYTGSGLSLNNPPRRDTALMPGAGWIAVGFETDNPGVWLLHCHIGWHAAMGFALQFVEMQDQIKGSGAGNNSCALNDTCSKWKTWADAHGEALATDSGI